MTTDDAKKNENNADQSSANTKTLPLLPLRELIVFPSTVVPLFVGREKSIQALEQAMSSNKEILLAAQKKAKTSDPSVDDIYTVGTISHILQLLRLPDGTVKVLVEGQKRAQITEFIKTDDLFLVEAEELPEAETNVVENEALVRTVKMAFDNYVRLNKRIPPEMLLSIAQIEDESKLADTLVAHLGNLKLSDKQELLEETNPKARLERLYGFIQSEIEIMRVEKKIRARVKRQMEKTQKEYYLNEQMAAIQKELGDRDDGRAEVQELEKQIKTKKLTKEAREKLDKELRKLKMMSPMSAEATVVRNYIETVLSLPWQEFTSEIHSIEFAANTLDQDHYGLEKVKDRILEYLSVRVLVEESKGPILCLVGPPGVGKTSLARSVATATGRKFVRIALGGVRDEAEIRGHRRTYIGSMPGKIINALKKSGSSNPVILLDEIDKLSNDFRGDPTSALLEVLDPEQNHTFVDHYLDIDYDLSKVLFIATANTAHTISKPLLDRMETLQLSGYTEEEKLAIAQQYLVPKQIKSNGLSHSDVQVQPKAIREVIRHFTREAGVRNLDREMGSLLRKVARKHLQSYIKSNPKEADKLFPIPKVEAQVQTNAENTDIDIDDQYRDDIEVAETAPMTAESKPTTDNQNIGKLIQEKMQIKEKITEKSVVKYLGPRKFRHGVVNENHEIGLCTGLAWTEVGGDILVTEVTILPGKGKLTCTGKLGEVMQESAQAALSYVRSRAAFLGLEEDFYQNVDIHIHVPEGAIPKDGPSAGIAMATALTSALTNRPIDKETAMTGEITLRGRVLPIGGLKEKVIAAHRGGIRRVIIPLENEKDLVDIPKNIQKDMKIFPVDHVDQVLMHALVWHKSSKSGDKVDDKLYEKLQQINKLSSQNIDLAIAH